MRVVFDSERHIGGRPRRVDSSDRGRLASVGALGSTLLVLVFAPLGCGTSSSSASSAKGVLDGGDAAVVSSDAGPEDATMTDAADRDAACVGLPPRGACSACTCVAGQWVCGTTQCAPDAAGIDDASRPSDASSVNDASGVNDAASVSDSSSADGSAGVSCGGAVCAVREWCDTSEASATCRCGLVGGACGAGTQCCAFPQGCAALHCNEHCAATCP